MAIAIKATITTSAQSGSLADVNHTIDSGSDLLVVMISTDSYAAPGDTITAITWDQPTANESLVLLQRNTNEVAVVTEIWTLKDPTVKTANLSFTRSGSEGVAINISNWSGADLDTGFETNTSQGSSGESTLTNPTATWAAGDFFISTHGIDSDEGATERMGHPTIGSGVEETTTANFGTYSEYLDANWGTHGFEGFNDQWSTVGFRLAAIQSSSSSSSSRSSSSSSSLSSSSSSSSLSSSSTPEGTVVWGHHTGVTEDYDENIDTNWTETDGWTEGGTPGNDNETIAATLCLSETESEDWHLGAMEAKIEIDHYDSGSGPAPTIQYKTHANRSGLPGASWNVYDGSSFTSLGWVKIKLIHT